MKIIGIVGGIGSGKSTIARYMERDHEACLIEVDKIVHKVLNLPEIADQIYAKFRKYGYRKGVSDNIFTGQAVAVTDRKAVGRVVLSNEEEFKWLEKLTFPIVDEMLRKSLSRYIDGIPAVVLDCPLLFESNWDKLCDIIVFVDTDHETRCQRFMARTMEQNAKEKWEALEKRQMPLEEKRQRSNFVIDNNKSHQIPIDRFWEMYVLGEHVIPEPERT